MPSSDVVQLPVFGEGLHTWGGITPDAARAVLAHDDRGRPNAYVVALRLRAACVLSDATLAKVQPVREAA